MKTLTLARYALETSLMFYDFIRASDSLVAAGCLLLALRMQKLGDWVNPLLNGIENLCFIDAGAA